MATTPRDGFGVPAASVGRKDIALELIDDSTASKVTVLDTSVLIADPGVLSALGAENLVIPLVVIEELDGLKTREGAGDWAVGWAAREAVRALEGAGGSKGLRGAVPLPEGGTLQVLLNGAHLAPMERLGLDIRKADNRILGVCLGLLAKDVDVTLLSADGALRIKAARLGVTVREHAYRATASTLPPGFRTLKVEDGLLADLRDGVCVEGSELDVAVRPGEYLMLQSRRGSAKSLLVRNHGGLLSQLSPVEGLGISSRSAEQAIALDLLTDPDILVVGLVGNAGTGKTLVAMAAGVGQVLERDIQRYKGVDIYRPVVPAGAHDLGFLPGSLEDKIDPWTGAIMDNIAHVGGPNVLEELVARKALTFGSIAHTRGRSFSDRYVLVDEAQNLEVSMLKLLLTRVGGGCKIVFTGDPSQIDAPYLSAHNNALTALVSTFAEEPYFGHVVLRRGERSIVAERAAELL